MLFFDDRTVWREVSNFAGPMLPAHPRRLGRRQQVEKFVPQAVVMEPFAFEMFVRATQFEFQRADMIRHFQAPAKSAILAEQHGPQRAEQEPGNSVKQGALQGKRFDHTPTLGGSNAPATPGTL